MSVAPANTPAAPAPAAPSPAAPSPPAPSPAAPGPEAVAALWKRGLTREHGFQPLRVEGRLPGELRGTLVRNGPGQFEQFGRPYRHPFEADGALSAVRFDGSGGALGSARLTPSAGLVEERAAGRILYGLSAPWPRRVLNLLRGRQKNTANTNVMAWQGRLFALMEGAGPTEIDPGTLDVIGETDLGMVRGGFSAHPHRVAARRASYNFGLQYGRRTLLYWYELPDAGPARRLGQLELGGPTMLHDFIATESHLVFFVSPIRINVARLLLQVGGFQDMFQWRPERGTEVICIPIDRPSEVVRFHHDAFFQWHFTNAFDRGGELVIDYVRYPDFDSFNAIGLRAAERTFAHGGYHRAVVDPARRTLRSELVWDHACEFPRIHPGREGGRHEVAWLALGQLEGIARVDAGNGAVSQHSLPAHQRASEPLFVPRPGGTAEDDGWLLVLCADLAAERSFVAVHDARRIADAPLARVWFDHLIPITFHGGWLPA